MFEEKMHNFIKENKLTAAADAQAALKDLFGEMLQHMLEAELDNELGYIPMTTTLPTDGTATVRRKYHNSSGIDIKVPRYRQAPP